MRVFANIVHSVTRAHACQFVEIHACTLTLYHAFTCVFMTITFDWEEQQSIIQVSRKHSAQEDEKPSTPSTPNTKEDASS